MLLAFLKCQAAISTKPNVYIRKFNHSIKTIIKAHAKEIMSINKKGSTKGVVFFFSISCKLCMKIFIDTQ